MKTVKIDWDAFLCTVRQFPHLRQIAVRYDRYVLPAFPLGQMLVEFVAHLGDAWASQGSLLGLYFDTWTDHQDEINWDQRQLDRLMGEIKQRV